MPRSLCRNSLTISAFLCLAVVFSSAQTQVASLHPGNGLVWQRTSPTAEKPDGPVLYQLLFSTAGTPNTVAKFDTNPRHLTTSQITDDGTVVTIGGASGLVVNASGNVLTFNSVSLLGGGGGGLAFVTHDSSLIGLGTVGTPLGINVSGVGNLQIANAAVTFSKLGFGPATSGQVLTANGSGGASWQASSTGNFVDLTSDQTIGGNKTFTNTITGNGDLALPNTSSALVGVITLGGVPFMHNFGTSNTFLGATAGNTSVLTGGGNTGVGAGALFANATGPNNSAFGTAALRSNISGGANSAFGVSALLANTSGSSNSAFGAFALAANSSGTFNSAFGSNALQKNTLGVANDAFGILALTSNISGNDNDAFGDQALASNTTGLGNDAFGFMALLSNTSGAENGAFGYQALQNNTTGSGNFAFGALALNSNSTGQNNAAFGGNALNFNEIGNDNAAFGASALFLNEASQNSAFGFSALNNNTLGNTNSAFGYNALSSSSLGNANSAFGSGALNASSTGSFNAAFGAGALNNLASGSDDIAIGRLAGTDLTSSESDNIEIGNVGVAGDSGTIRIGTAGTHTQIIVAGVATTTISSGTGVVVGPGGRLGVATSSKRYKHEISTMGGESDVLMKLRPVSFYYKPELDPMQTRQYGLVAEEVARFAPQLVLYGEDGLPQSVRYNFVDAMLLNEVQKQRRQLEEQQTTITRQHEQIQAMQQQMDAAMLRLAAVERSVQPGTRKAGGR